MALNTKIDAALAYAALGIAVFPCHSMERGRCSCGGKCGGSAGKHPRTIAGHTEATTNQDTIRLWWSAWPDANIGASMKASKLIALDVDPRHGGDESWRGLERDYGASIAETWTNLTGGGGVHYLYRAPDGFDTHTDTIAQGVDVKWSGYVILPPSDHQNGRHYEWEAGWSPDDCIPAILPSALSARIISRNDATSSGERVPVSELLVRDCPEGERNDTLASIAGYLRNEVAQDVAEAMCQAWNTAHCKPALDTLEVTRTVAGMYLRYAAPATVKFGAESGTPSSDGLFEIIDAPDYLDRPPTRWQVKKLLPERCFATIVGGPGSYKSFIALDLVACVSLGVPFHGFETVQGSCLYIAGEGAGGFAQRMRAWQRHHKQQLPRALKILPSAVPLIDRTAVAALVDQISAFGETFAVIVVDTLSRAIAGEDENASAPMTKAVAAAELLQQTFGCCVVVIHHGRKSDGEIRGHGSLKGALDTVWLIERDKGKDTVQVEIGKQKDGEEIDPFSLRPVVVDVTRPADLHHVGDERVTSLAFDRVSVDEEREQQRTRRVARMNHDQRVTLQALASFGETGAISRDWLEKARELAEERTARSTFYRRVEALVDAGLVIIPTARDGEGVYVATRDARDAFASQDATALLKKGTQGTHGDARGRIASPMSLEEGTQGTHTL